MLRITKMILAAGLVAATLGYFFQKSFSCTPCKATLTLGIASGYAPFISTNAHGDYEGFDIDVARAVSHELDKELILKDLGSMTSLLIALDQGSVDAVIWGLSITQERLEKMGMVHYQGADTTSYPLIFWKSIPAGVTSLDDMKGMTICVEPGSSQAATLQQYASSITQLPTERIDDALLTIQYNKAAAALVEPAIAKKFKRAYPEIQILEIPLQPQHQTRGVGIAVKKDNIALQKALEKAVATLKENGMIAQAENAWGIA